MKKERIPLIKAEVDVMTPWRRLLCYTQRAGVCSDVKRQYRRRLRARVRRAIHNRTEG